MAPFERFLQDLAYLIPNLISRQQCHKKNSKVARKIIRFGQILIKIAIYDDIVKEYKNAYF